MKAELRAEMEAKAQIDQFTKTHQASTSRNRGQFPSNTDFHPKLEAMNLRSRTKIGEEAELIPQGTR